MSAYVSETRQGMTVISFTTAELSSTATILEIGKGLEALIQQGDVRWLLLSFRNLTFINSEMIGRLTMLHKKCRTANVSLKICDVNEYLYRMLKLVRLDVLFEILANEEEALASFRAQSGGEGTQPLVLGKNEPASADAHRAAAEAGNPKSQFQLGRCFENGWGVPQDFQKAVRWYEKASGHNHAEAQYALAHCYAYGIGVEQDYDEAVQLYSLAAEQGHLEAEYAMGMSYEYGLGVDTDFNEAIKWYRKAAARGDTRSKEALTHLLEEQQSQE